jgi:hypothetical protein
MTQTKPSISVAIVTVPWLMASLILPSYGEPAEDAATLEPPPTLPPMATVTPETTAALLVLARLEGEANIAFNAPANLQQ